MYWHLLILALVLGVAFGAFLVWFRTRREMRRARIVGEYVDALMESGPGSYVAFDIYTKYSEDKELSDAFDTAMDLYLALRQAQKTNGP